MSELLYYSVSLTSCALRNFFCCWGSINWHSVVIYGEVITSAIDKWTVPLWAICISVIPMCLPTPDKCMYSYVARSHFLVVSNDKVLCYIPIIIAYLGVLLWKNIVCSVNEGFMLFAGKKSFLFCTRDCLLAPILTIKWKNHRFLVCVFEEVQIDNFFSCG